MDNLRKNILILAMVSGSFICSGKLIFLQRPTDTEGCMIIFVWIISMIASAITVCGLYNKE